MCITLLPCSSVPMEKGREEIKFPVQWGHRCLGANLQFVFQQLKRKIFTRPQRRHRSKANLFPIPKPHRHPVSHSSKQISNQRSAGMERLLSHQLQKKSSKFSLRGLIQSSPFSRGSSLRLASVSTMQAKDFLLSQPINKIQSKASGSAGC